MNFTQIKVMARTKTKMKLNIKIWPFENIMATEEDILKGLKDGKVILDFKLFVGRSLIIRKKDYRVLGEIII